MPDSEDWTFPDMEQTYTVLWKRASKSVSEKLIVKYLDQEQSSPSPEYHLGILKGEVGGLNELWSLEELAIYAEAFPTQLISPPSEPDKKVDNAGWGLAAVGADKSAYSGEGVVAAVLDTGIDASHEAFKSVDLKVEDFSGTGAGDANGHGTHCAGTFFGGDVGGVRIGVARGIKRALIGKVFDDKGRGTSDMIFKGLNWAINSEASIISMSLGIDFTGQVKKWTDRKVPPEVAISLTLDSYRRNLLLFDALMGLARKKEAKDIPLIVAAAGNDSKRNIQPNHRLSVTFPGVTADLSVAAVGPSNDSYSVAPFSNGNATISAPGMDIVSARTGGGVVTWSGTSMACPHVAGVAALWSEKLRKDGPDGNADTVRSHIVTSAIRERLAPSWNAIDFGKGLVTAP